MTASPYGPELWGHHFPPSESPVAPSLHGDLFDFLETAARDHAERPHIRFQGETWTYGQTLDLSLRLAAGLVRLGIAPGDRIGLCLPNTPAYIVLCYAIWRIGAVGVGMNSLYTEHHLRQQAVDAGLKLLFGLQDDPALGKVRAAAEAAGCGMILVRADGQDLADGGGAVEADTLSGLLRQPPLPDSHPRPSHAALAMLQYTGGTTGAPKGAMLSHHALVTVSKMALNCLPYIRRGVDAYHAAAPLSHISGLINYACIATAAAAEVLLVARFSTAEVLEQLRAGRPTVLTAIPTMLTALLAEPDLETYDWSRIKHVVAGGAAVPLELARRLRELTGLSVQQAYGMTETGGAAAFMPVTQVVGHEDATGAPMPGVQVEIRSIEDPATPVAVGERGEICIGGENLMDGYWRAADPRGHLTPDGLMRSGDIGLISPEGFLYVVDRLKDVVVCSGYNVYPRLIDEAVLTHPAIQEAMAVGVPDNYRGETILVAAVLRPGHELSLAQLQSFLADKLSPIEMPKQLTILDALPKSENGKLSRLLLRRQLAAA